jgi:hypothetical protein
MNNFFVILLMIFCHIVDDYYLQGILASMKQKKWWQENAPDKPYKYDYIWALIMHSFSWAFMIMLPIAFKTNFEIGIGFVPKSRMMEAKCNKYSVFYCFAMFFVL